MSQCISKNNSIISRFYFRANIIIFIIDQSHTVTVFSISHHQCLIHFSIIGPGHPIPPPDVKSIVLPTFFFFHSTSHVTKNYKKPHTHTHTHIQHINSPPYLALITSTYVSRQGGLYDYFGCTSDFFSNLYYYTGMLNRKLTVERDFRRMA